MFRIWMPDSPDMCGRKANLLIQKISGSIDQITSQLVQAYTSSIAFEGNLNFCLKKGGGGRDSVFSPSLFLQ